MLYGGQNSIVIGFAAVVLSIVIGGTLGMLAGYFKKAEAIIMRLIDIQIAIPGILFAIVIVATLGDSLINVVFSVAIFSIPTMTRVVRSEVLSLKKANSCRLRKHMVCRIIASSLSTSCPTSYTP